MMSAQLGEQFDVVIFMGVLYHLRHPLLALDLIHEHVARDLFRLPVDATGQPGGGACGGAIILLPKQAFSSGLIIRRCTSSSGATRMTRPTGGFPIAPAPRPCCAAPASTIIAHPEEEVFLCRRAETPRARRAMIEAVKFWNEPNNKSHWDFQNHDPEWEIFAAMVKLAGQAVAAENPQLTRVLGGMSPIDASFITRLQERGVLDVFDAVAVHGFPLDWNNWLLDEWPAQLAEIQAVTALPVWVTEVGVSTFGAEEVQEFGLRRTARTAHRPRAAHPLVQPLRSAQGVAGDHPPPRGGRLFLLPAFPHGVAARRWRAEARAAGTLPNSPQRWGFASGSISKTTGWTMPCAGFQRLGVQHVRTGLSWADSFRPGWEAWFDRQMLALEEFEVTATFCFTPEHRGPGAHHTSPPFEIEEYAEFCARMVRRYAPGATLSALAPVLVPS